jgi:hypothetical protein
VGVGITVGVGLGLAVCVGSSVGTGTYGLTQPTSDPKITKKTINFGILPGINLACLHRTEDNAWGTTLDVVCAMLATKKEFNFLIYFLSLPNRTNTQVNFTRIRLLKTKY